MFPINYNDPYAKNDGSVVPIGDVIGGGGGGSDLPDYDETDAGKVLGVNDSGNLEWVTVSGGSNFGKTEWNGSTIVPNISVKGGV